MGILRRLELAGWCLLAITLGLLVALVMLPQGASAHTTQAGTATAEVQPDVRFAILPLEGDGYFESTTNPGDSILHQARVINTDNESVKLVLYVTNADSAANGGFSAGDVDDELRGASLWTDFPRLEIELSPNEMQVVDFTIIVPDDARPGQYVSAIVAETVDAMPIPGNETFDHKIRYASAIVINVPGDISANFTLGKPYWVSSAILIPIANSGNTLVKPAGEITLYDSNGGIVLSGPVVLGSIYAETETLIDISLPPQLPGGDYTVSLELVDAETGVVASIEDAALTIPEAGAEDGIFIVNASLEPNAAEIVFANVIITLDNGGEQIGATTITLSVFRDGELVDEFPMATNQVMLSGENEYVTRYIPPEMWESGTYTFRISVLAVDPNGGQQIEILNEPLDAEIIVP